MKKLTFVLITLFALHNSFAQGQADTAPVLVDIKWLKELKLPYLYQHPETSVALSLLTEAEREKLSKHVHQNGSCGGYQLLSSDVYKQNGKIREFSSESIDLIFNPLVEALRTEKQYQSKPLKAQSIVYDENIADALKKVDETQITDWVTWLESFGGRFHASNDPNIHTRALAERLTAAVKDVPYASVRLVDHRSTRQKSVALTLTGANKPSEIIVLGGHLDSINHAMFGDKNNAPGADDNASGSAALAESLRVLLAQGQPQRTIEYFWYAAEEVGLNGSNEIATQYRSQNKDVVAVLQLDMVLFPGLGEGVISSISDYTSGWLRDLLLEINQHYLNVRIVDDKCGYACSDHASWFQKGYSTLMPFEADTKTMNRKIHTPNDRLSPALSAKHAAVFSRIAVAYAMILANSDLRGQRFTQ